MRYREIIESRLDESFERISPQAAKDRKLFGPLYHGTTRSRQDILDQGFNIKHSVPHGLGLKAVNGFWRNDVPIGTSNGYTMDPYFAGVAAPVHHLGFGIYFTTVKSIAKMYGGDSMKGVLEFWVDAPEMIEINFGAPRTMMKWWMENGYGFTAEETEQRDFRAWVRETGNLTRNLRKHGAVHFLGKGIRRLLDGDQVCVYDPKRLYVVDKSLANGLEIGAKVVHTGRVNIPDRFANQQYVDDLRPTDFRSWGKLGAMGGWRGIFWAVDHEGNEVPRSNASPRHLLPPKGMVGEIVNVRFGPNGNHYDVKWSKGGVQHNYTDGELQPK